MKIKFIEILQDADYDRLVIRTNLTSTCLKSGIGADEPTDLLVNVEKGYGKEWAKKNFPGIELRIHARGLNR